MGELAVYAAPLPFSNKQTKTILPEGLSVQEIFDHICPVRYCGAVDASILIDGRPVYHNDWALVRPKLGSIVNVRIVPMGGGGGGKNPIVSLLSIAVLIAAPYMAGLYATGAALAVYGGGVATAAQVALMQGVLTFSFSAVGMLLVSALAPPPKQSYAGTLSNPSESSTQFIEGASNALNPYGVVPICLGTNRMFPLQAARPFTEAENNNQYVRQIFTYGFGDEIEISDLKIGDTDLSNFTDYDIQHKLNGDLHDGTALYSNDVFQDDYNVLLEQVNGYTQRSVHPAADEAIVDVTFPNGLVLYNNDASQGQRSVTLQIQLITTGTETLISDEEITIKAAQASALRRSLRLVFPSNGNYDIKIKRVTADATTQQEVDAVYLTAIKAVTYTAPIKCEGINGTAIRMKATDQLNGVVDQFNCTVSNLTPDYDAPSETWITRATSNPASLYRYVLQGGANARPMADSKIDLETLIIWHAYCEERGYSYNRVIDYATSVDEILRDVASAGSASPAIIDNKRSVVVDMPKEEVKQIITPRNSWNYSGEMIFPDLPHALRVQFRNAEKGYSQDERIVYDDGYDASTAMLYETLEVNSCTNSDLAYKWGRRVFALAKLRPEAHSFMMDVENLVAVRGDRVKIEHDVPIIGVGDGRIKEVLTATGNVTGIVVDDTISIPTSGTYYVRIRKADGEQLYKQIVASVGNFAIFEFTYPFDEADAPEVGDLCYFTQSGGELDAIITKIEPAADLMAKITCLNYAPEIFDADTGTIPTWESNITVPLEFIRPISPVLLMAQSDEGVLIKNSDGSFTGRAIFSLENGNDGDIIVEAKLRRSGDTAFYNANVLEAQPDRVAITGLEDGVRYDIHIRYRRSGGAGVFSLPLQLNNYLYVGASGVPADVEGFAVTLADGSSFFKWLANNDIDISHYILKYSPLYTGATWETAQILEATIYENRIVLPVHGGTFLLKAVDLSGNESESAAVIIAYNYDSGKNVVETLTENPSFSGTKDDVVLAGGVLKLDDPDVEVGYYYFANDIDLTDVFTSFVSASVTAYGVDISGGASNNVFDMDDVFAVDDIFGIGVNAWSVSLEFRTTEDDPSDAGVTWTAWVTLFAGEALFRGAQFRLKLESLRSGVSPAVSALAASIDMPDRVERGDDLTVPVAGTTITYPADFKSNPAVTILLQDGDADDEIEFSSKTDSGFTFKVYNSGSSTYVERTYDYISSGYGRVNV